MAGTERFAIANASMQLASRGLEDTTSHITFVLAPTMGTYAEPTQTVRPARWLA